MIVFGANEQADKLVFIQKNIGCSYIIIQSEKFDSKAFDKVIGNIGIRRALEEMREKGELSMLAAKILEEQLIAEAKSK